MKASEKTHRTALDTDPKKYIALSPKETHELAIEVAQLETDNEQLKNRAKSAETVVAKIPSLIWENIIDELYEEAQVLGGEQVAKEQS